MVGMSGHNYRPAIEFVRKAGVYAYRDRRQRKRHFRTLWITRLSAALRARGIPYNRFIPALVAAGIIDDKLDSILNVQIIADPSDAVIIRVDYVADERLCDLVGGWGQVEQAYADQMAGRRARLLREEIAAEEAQEGSERNKTLPSTRTDGWDDPNE